MSKGLVTLSRHDPGCLNRTHVWIERADSAKAFVEDYENRWHPCCHGHQDCSTYAGGPCLDETLSNFPELAEQ